MGPLGLIANSGIFTATLNVVGSSVETQLAGNDIMANVGTVNLSTSGTFTAANGQRTLHAISQSTGTGPNGNSVNHAYTATKNGNGSATVNQTRTGPNGGGSTSSKTYQQPDW